MTFKHTLCLVLLHAGHTNMTPIWSLPLNSWFSPRKQIFWQLPAVKGQSEHKESMNYGGEIIKAYTYRRPDTSLAMSNGFA